MKRILGLCALFAVACEPPFPTNDANIEDVQIPDTRRPDARPDVQTPDVVSVDMVVVDEAMTEASMQDDAAAEASPDAQLDAMPEAIAPDVLPDVAPDVVMDVQPDVRPDVLVDVQPDVPTISFGSRCMPTDACAAPAGEVGSCAANYPGPVCTHTCNRQADYSLCAGGAGVCVPNGTTKICLPKCGDQENRTCGAGASCQVLGIVDRRSSGGTFPNIGVCLPDCSSTGPDACLLPTHACNAGTRSCAPLGCGGMCPTGTTCMGSSCVPNVPTPLYGSCTPRAGVASTCVGDQCIGVLNQPGFCTTPCNTTDAVTSCGTGGICYTNFEIVPPNDGGVIGAPLLQFETVGRTAGICVRSCTDGSNCPLGFFCGNYNGGRACIPGSLARAAGRGDASIPPGGVCAQNADCASGRCAALEGYRDGICVRATMGSPCPTNTASAPDGITCLPRCTGMRPNECPGVMVCDTTQGLCLFGPCRENADCRMGFVCNPASGACIAPTPPPAPAGAVGTLCTSNMDCGGGCLPQRTLDGGIVQFVGGYCTQNCTVHPDYSDSCPAGAVCNTNIPGVASFCLDLCDTNPLGTRFGTCRTGYRCAPYPYEPRYGVCFPQ